MWTDYLVLDAEHLPWLVLLLAIVSVIIQIALAVRVVMRRRNVGESLAWIFLVLILPIGGPLVYLLFGELRLGSRRARRIAELQRPFASWLRGLERRLETEDQHLPRDLMGLGQLGERTLGMPPLPGNGVELLSDWQHVFDRMIADIDAAQQHCHVEFYILQTGGRVDDVLAALERAAARGVTCRLLVDAVGSRPFVRSRRIHELRERGIEVIAALPGGFIRMWFVRFDLRLHRKIVVIDGEIGYTGSLNLVDPRYFKQSSGVGQWVDAMVRVTGPAVEALAITFLADWYVESNETLDQLKSIALLPPPEVTGNMWLQVLPSGPTNVEDAIGQVLVAAVYSAERELVLTSPYFVPNEPLMTALVTAARRGVEVTLVVPERVDSLLVRYATRAYQFDLLRAGVRIVHFGDGLLHTKSVTIDNRVALFGSLNLDERSFYLNFEITLAAFDRKCATSLRGLQDEYIARSRPLTVQDIARRRPLVRFAENVARLFGPVL